MRIVKYFRNTQLIIITSIVLFCSVCCFIDKNSPLLDPFEYLIGNYYASLPVFIIGLLSFIYLLISLIIHVKISNVSLVQSVNIKYISKNNSKYVWFLPIIFLVLDFLIIGVNMDNASYIIMPTLIGGGFGALIFWLSNKDLSVFIDDKKLIIKRNKSDVREYLSSEIVSYRVLKEQNKTILRITGNDKSEYQIASFALDLKGFENAMKEFLETYIDNNIVVEKKINETPKEIEHPNLQSNSVNVDKLENPLKLTP